LRGGGELQVAKERSILDFKDRELGKARAFYFFFFIHGLLDSTCTFEDAIVLSLATTIAIIEVLGLLKMVLEKQLKRFESE